MSGPVRPVQAASTDVRVWVLPIEAARRMRLDHLLGDAERARAGQFKRRDDAIRYVAGRVLLRLAAADLLARRVHDVGLSRHCPVCHSTEHGRPVVTGAAGAPYLSLTHGGDVIAVAAAGAPVGIDVERYGGRGDLDGIGRRMLTAAERAAVAAGEASTFYDLWTLKEAFLKASGLALDDLGGVEVLPALAGPAWIEHGASSMLCRRLELAPGHAGALAASSGQIVRRDAVAAVRSLDAAVGALPRR